MPEGDTIWRSAKVLHRVLADAELLRVRIADPRLGRAERLVRSTLSRVQARGKHLLMHGDEVVLHSHMGMHGSWHVYRPHELEAQAHRFARAHIELHTKHIAVCCTRPSVLEALRPDQLRVHPSLSRLGPDLLAPDFDAEMALERLRTRASTPFGEAIMDQRVIAGIGNVYKAELCFLQRLNPFATVLQIDSQDSRALPLFVSTARACMLENLERNTRVTRFVEGREAGVWVYERSGRPCHRCGTTIRVRRQSELGRTTYFCTRCQGVSAQ